MSRLRGQLALALMVVMAGVLLGVVLGGGLGSFAPRATDAGDQTSGAPVSPAATVVATDTAVAVALATPTAATTPAPAESASASPTVTSAPEVIIDYDFATPIVGLPQVFTDTWSAGVVDGRYQMRLNGRTSVSFAGPLPFEHYRLSVDIAVQQGGAGVIFLAEEPNVIYRFLVTPDGAFAIERQAEATDALQLVPWTASPALAATPGNENRIRIERPGDGQIHFFAGETLLTSLAVPTGAVQNRYGLVLAARQGQAAATFDNLRVERLP